MHKYLSYQTVFMFLFIIPFIQAVECGTTPTDSCTVTQSTTFNQGVYNLPNGITVQGSDIILDCNGALLQGSDGPRSGITIEGGNRNTVKNCQITNYIIGLRINTHYNTIINNYVSSNRDHGLSLYVADYNIIAHNIVINNNQDGIEPSNSNYNLIYDNNFTNTNNVRNGGSSNYWNTSRTQQTNIVGGPFIGGNYFSDYTGVDLNNDGIGDTEIPHTAGGSISSPSGDYLPLVAVQPPQLISPPQLLNPPRIGATVDIELSDPLNPNTDYLLAMSLGNTPGMTLLDNRNIPLNYDLFLQTSLFNPFSLGLYSSQSRFNNNGVGTAFWNIPNNPSLAGQDIYVGFVTVDLHNPLPQAIISISESRKIKILPHHFTPDTNTVALWNFNENSGDVLTDLSGNGNNGQVRGATWTTGLEGSALRFDGVDDYVNVSDSSTLALPNAFTIEAYVNYEGGLQDTTVDTVVGKDYQYVFGVGDNIYPGRLAFTLANQPSSLCPGPWCDGVAAVPQNAWHHVAVQYNGQTIKTIMDGQVMSEYPVQFTVGSAPTALGIGARLVFALDADPVPVAFFKGKIDEVRISNIARY